MGFLGCRKGSRSCAYPEPRPNTKTKSSLSQTCNAALESDSSADDGDNKEKDIDPESLKNPPVPERSAKPASKSQRRSRAASTKMNRRRSSPPRDHPLPSVEQANYFKDKSLSPPTDDSSAPSTTQSISAGLNRSEKFSSVSTAPSLEASIWSNLSANLQYHLEYHRKLTWHHYFFKHEANNFIHHILVEHAISFEPLLYAVVGFAAFQRTLQSRRGRIQDFLGYYNKSVTLLRKSLFDSREHTPATLLTILQLATFEVRSTHVGSQLAKKSTGIPR